MELVDHPHLPPAEDGQLFLALGIDVLAVQIHLPTGGDIHPADDVEEGGLAGTRGADDGGELPLVDTEGHVVYGGDLVALLAVDLAQVFHT